MGILLKQCFNSVFPGSFFLGLSLWVCCRQCCLRHRSVTIHRRPVNQACESSWPFYLFRFVVTPGCHVLCVAVCVALGRAGGVGRSRPWKLTAPSGGRRWQWKGRWVSLAKYGRRLVRAAFTRKVQKKHYIRKNSVITVLFRSCEKICYNSVIPEWRKNRLRKNIVIT